MSITKERKQELIKQFQQHENDTGSVEVQIAILTERINRLAQHFEKHKHDTNSKRGLLGLVGRRRKLLKYLARTNPERYQEVIAKLGLRK
ncbi:small subunit ribosomal protein S15 [Thermosulfidibacter takaii ABI70S6]|uniref:Small ribosomal subunit protein uS15 n=1 Tax=Thermosulfidibacter takaii (strain DSM 17441 / JCM 13301 / NBRC 103674 / ABI70S6) TaxID=1298851 RepID=A0A0S3QSD9_THET7|nr:30S ribosomal protein S15 [Thermosulfidibacter takaii]BAT71259.1 small subunit ribosomal protein S15 [Thermosulfidibacter takaii ABI70S6]